MGAPFKNTLSLLGQIPAEVMNLCTGLLLSTTRRENTTRQWNQQWQKDHWKIQGNQVKVIWPKICKSISSREFKEIKAKHQDIKNQHTTTPKICKFKLRRQESTMLWILLEANRYSCNKKINKLKNTRLGASQYNNKSKTELVFN